MTSAFVVVVVFCLFVFCLFFVLLLLLLPDHQISSSDLADVQSEADV